MTNWKKKAEELPHFEPAHVSQNKALDDILNTVPGLPQQTQPISDRTSQNGGWKEVDAGHMFSQVMQKRLYQQNLQQDIPEQQNASVVTIREGQNFFRKLEVSIPSDINLATKAGLVQGISGREFEFKGIQNFYILENPNETVDLSKIDRSKLIKLAVVTAPFIGTLLVSENAVMKQQSRGQQLLRG